MFCQSCGEPLIKDADLCASCGIKTIKEEEKKSEPSSSVFIVLGFIFPVIALVFFPPVFGAAGIYFGFRVKKTSQHLGVLIILLNVICLILGMFIAISYFNGLI